MYLDLTKKQCTKTMKCGNYRILIIVMVSSQKFREIKVCISSASEEWISRNILCGKECFNFFTLTLLCEFWYNFREITFLSGISSVTWFHEFSRVYQLEVCCGVGQKLCYLLFENWEKSDTRPRFVHKNGQLSPIKLI